MVYLRLALMSLLLICSTLSSDAFAARVKSVKGKRVIVNLEGDSVRVGEVMQVKNSSGKTVALVKIRKIKGQSALAQLGKGKVSAGMEVVARGTKASKAASSSGQIPTNLPDNNPRSYIGGMLGYAMGNITADVGASNVTMTGGAVSAKAFFDYEMFPKVWFRGSTGLEGLNGKGPTNASCASGSACTLNVSYLSFDFWGRYVFGGGAFRPWAGAGFSLMFPLSKSATAVLPSSISETNVISIGGGIDIHGRGYYIPIQLEYGMYPQSETVNASAISLRVGYGFPF